jgi:hydrogenase nickel incorporation protein HypA/HybF
MHELSLTQSILNIIEEYAVKHAFDRVHSLKLSFGKISCIDPKALTFSFNVQSAGTRAEGASLLFDIHPIVIHCFSCDKDTEIPSYDSICPLCNGHEVMLTGGTEELKLIELDVD